MLVFALILYVYSLAVGKGRFNMIPREYAAHADDKEEYARRFGKVVRLVALAPVISGVLSLLLNLIFDDSDVIIMISVISLIVLVIIFLAAGAGQMYKDTDPKESDPDMDLWGRSHGVISPGAALDNHHGFIIIN